MELEFLIWRLAAYGSLIGILATLVFVTVEAREKRISFSKVLLGCLPGLLLAVLSLGAVLSIRTANFYYRHPEAKMEEVLNSIAPSFSSPVPGIITYSFALVLCTLLAWLLTKIPPLRAMAGIIIKLGALFLFTLYQLSMGLPVILLDLELL